MKNIAVFIDADNVNPNDIQKIMYDIGTRGTIIIRRVYGDWSQPNLSAYRDRSIELGLKRVQCDRIARKNSTDIRLAIDVMNVLLTNDKIDIFCIVSSDADYVHLSEPISVSGKTAMCVGSITANKAHGSFSRHTWQAILESVKIFKSRKNYKFN